MHMGPDNSLYHAVKFVQSAILQFVEPAIPYNQVRPVSYTISSSLSSRLYRIIKFVQLAIPYHQVCLVSYTLSSSLSSRLYLII